MAAQHKYAQGALVKGVFSCRRGRTPSAIVSAALDGPTKPQSGPFAADFQDSFPFLAVSGRSRSGPSAGLRYPAGTRTVTMLRTLPPKQPRQMPVGPRSNLFAAFQPAAGFLQPLLQTGQRHSSMDCGQYQQPPQVCPGYKGSEVDPVSQSCLGKIERRRSQMPQTHRPIRAGILVANCGVGSCRPQQ